MIDINKKYVTRDGREVRIYATDGGLPHTIHGAVQRLLGEWIAHSWYPSGKSGYTESAFGLIEVKPRHKRTVWLNVYKDIVCAYMSKSDAAMSADFDRIACIKVELDFEEGEGL